MMELNEKLIDKFSTFNKEQKRQLICAVSSHVVSVLYPEKEAHFKENLEGLDKTSLEWLTRFLTTHIKETNGG